ncbi:MAG TPA: hypothetical protein VE864_07915, partial [Streptosporangiaceae bacterium]|nr:hypothetical protein [Streptosporangiaceae bacterium]
MAAFTLSELLPITVPDVPDPRWRAGAVWSALWGASAGAGMLALAAFAPRRRLRRRGGALAGSVALVTVVVGAVVAIVVSFAAHLPELPVMASVDGAPIRPTPGADARLFTLE